MSYCRWSCDNWMSDVYVYEGYTYVIHVAKFRRKHPPIPEIPLHRLPRLGAKYDPETGRTDYPSTLHRIVHQAILRLWWVLSHRLSMWHLKHIPLVPINLRCAGETFEFDSPLECYFKLLELRELGYNVPFRATDQLLSEAAER